MRKQFGYLFLFILLIFGTMGCGISDSDGSIPQYYKDHPDAYFRMMKEQEYNDKLKQEIKSKTDEQQYWNSKK